LTSSCRTRLRCFSSIPMRSNAVFAKVCSASTAARGDCCRSPARILVGHGIHCTSGQCPSRQLSLTWSPGLHWVGYRGGAPRESRTSPHGLGRPPATGAVRFVRGCAAYRHSSSSRSRRTASLSGPGGSRAGPGRAWRRSSSYSRRHPCG
jgi:hypothetical protein